MKKEFIIGLILSIAIHGILICNFNISKIKEENTFSKNEGLDQSRVSVRILKAIKKNNSQKTNGTKKKEIEKVARPKDQQSGSSLNSSGNQRALSKYLSSIRAKIAENQYKSKIAKRLNQRGKVKVGFKIINTNEISNINILGPSKSKQLNFSAIKTIQKIGSVPDIPKELDLEELSVEIEISY